MATLTDPEKLKKYLGALSDWNLSNGFEWTRLARDFVFSELGLTLRQFGEAMHEFVLGGGSVDYQIEQRGGFEYPDRYDLRMEIHARRVYIETRLHESRLHPPQIHVVNVKDQ